MIYWWQDFRVETDNKHHYKHLSSLRNIQHVLCQCFPNIFIKILWLCGAITHIKASEVVFLFG